VFFKQTLRGSQQTGLLFDGRSTLANESPAILGPGLFKVNTAYKFDAQPHLCHVGPRGFVAAA